MKIVLHKGEQWLAGVPGEAAQRVELVEQYTKRGRWPWQGMEDVEIWRTADQRLVRRSRRESAIEWQVSWRRAKGQTFQLA